MELSAMTLKSDLNQSVLSKAQHQNVRPRRDEEHRCP